MNNRKKIGRLWPLFLINILSVVVLILSLKTIFSDDNSVSVNVTLSQTSNIEIPASAVPSSSSTTAPADKSPTPDVEDDTDDSSASPVPTQTPAFSPTPTVSAKETPIPSELPQATPEIKQNVVIDNTIHEYSENIVHTEEGANNESSIASQIIQLVNEERINNGLAGLSYDANLAYAASVRAMEVTSNFSHTRPSGQDCFSAFPDGYIYMGENLASADGIISDSDFASGCVKWWMQSEGHRENILYSNYTSTAVGVYISGGAMYAVQLFGTPQ